MRLEINYNRRSNKTYSLGSCSVRLPVALPLNEWSAFIQHIHTPCDSVPKVCQGEKNYQIIIKCELMINIGGKSEYRQSRRSLH